MDDILTIVFSNLDVSQLLKCRQVCKNWKDIIKYTNTILYIDEDMTNVDFSHMFRYKIIPVKTELMVYTGWCSTPYYFTEIFYTDDKGQKILHCTTGPAVIDEAIQKQKQWWIHGVHMKSEVIDHIIVNGERIDF